LLSGPKKIRKASPASGPERRIAFENQSVEAAHDFNCDESFGTASQGVTSPFASCVSHSPLAEVRGTYTLPEFMGTDKDKLSACLLALSPSCDVYTLQFDSDGASHFEANLKSVETFLKSAVASKGQHGTRSSDPAALYICGVPGIGKTSGVTICCNKVIDDLGKNKPKVIRINAASLQSMNILQQEIGECLDLKKRNFNNDSIVRRLKKCVLIAVVDEIDLLVSTKANDLERDKVAGTERIVKTILEWANDPTLGFILIGISNSCGNTKYARLQQLGNVSWIDLQSNLPVWPISSLLISSVPRNYYFQTLFCG
jgi:hypothetical protein